MRRFFPSAVLAFQIGIFLQFSVFNIPGYLLLVNTRKSEFFDSAKRDLFYSNLLARVKSNECSIQKNSRSLARYFFSVYRFYRLSLAFVSQQNCRHYFLPDSTVFHRFRKYRLTRKKPTLMCAYVKCR